jgi:acyl dehydratase
MVFADDLVVGSVFDLGSHSVTAEEIVAFATQWDPQGFHVDEEIARAGAFGGLIASGLHSMAIFQRLAVDGAFSHWALIAGRSISDVQMTSPVRPGMELTGRITIAAVEARGPERSLVSKSCELLHEGTPVISFQGSSYIARRPAVD